MNYPEHWWELLARLVAAAICGGILGLDREWRDKPAGLRTNMIVAIGSAVFTLIALRIYDAVAGGSQGADPIRLVSGIVTGIGFLGAGAIMRTGGEVEGLTTAASVWLVGAIGVACGLAYFDLAAMSVVLGIIVLTVLGRFT